MSFPQFETVHTSLDILTPLDAQNNDMTKEFVTKLETSVDIMQSLEVRILASNDFNRETYRRLNKLNRVEIRFLSDENNSKILSKSRRGFYITDSAVYCNPKEDRAGYIKLIELRDPVGKEKYVELFKRMWGKSNETS